MGERMFGVDDDVYAVGLNPEMLGSYEVWEFKREHGEAEAFRAMRRAIHGEDNVFSEYVRVYSGRPSDMEWWQKQRERVFERDGHQCTYCPSTENLEVDHIQPLSRGGGHNLENLTTACATCNRSKGDKTLDEWRGQQ